MKLTDKHVELITRTTIEVLEKEKEKQEKRKHDRRLRNVKLLLRNYRSFVNHTKDIKLDIQDINEKLDLDEIDTDEFKLQSIKRSKEKTLTLVTFINKMIKVYKTMCEQSNNPEDQRRFKTIYDLYISEDKKTVEEVTQGHSVHKRTVYKDIDKACETLAVLMFGVDGVKFH